MSCPSTAIVWMVFAALPLLFQWIQMKCVDAKVPITCYHGTEVVDISLISFVSLIIRFEAFQTGKSTQHPLPIFVGLRKKNPHWLLIIYRFCIAHTRKPLTHTHPPCVGTFVLELWLQCSKTFDIPFYVLSSVAFFLECLSVYMLFIFGLLSLSFCWLTFCSI